jgi:hypothetical protein
LRANTASRKVYQRLKMNPKKLASNDCYESGRAMKQIFATVLAFLLLSATPLATAGNDDTGWSSPVNGLQARLGLARGQVLNGTPLITTYLELRNVANVANVMEVPLNLEAIQFEVVDDRDKLLAHTSLPYDGLNVELGMLRLPHDSCLHFDISHHGAGAPKNQAALLDLGVLNVWVFSPGDKRSYYLRGKFSIEPRKDRTWSGMIEIPKVKIPAAE